MPSIFSVRLPDIRSGMRADAAKIERDTRRAALEVTDLSSKKAQKHTQAKMRSVGLGKLANAVGQSSAKIKRQSGTPYGVIFARGGDDTRAAGAIKAYSEGAAIRPKGDGWLWIPQKTAPRFISAGGKRRRLTPALWTAAGLDTKIGKLMFIPLSSTRALLVVRKVSLSAKTGQAKRLGPRAPRTRVVPEGRNIVVFVGTKLTVRAKRFDQREIVKMYSDRNPEYMARVLAGYNRGST